VSKDKRYLMCFPETRSEIVVPILGQNGILGEVDIDSSRLGAFSENDSKMLEEIATILAAAIESGERKSL
jgi:GAF domain-containing protein